MHDNLNVTFCARDAKVNKNGRKGTWQTIFWYRYTLYSLFFCLNATTYAMHTDWQRKNHTSNRRKEFHRFLHRFAVFFVLRCSSFRFYSLPHSLPLSRSFICTSSFDFRLPHLHTYIHDSAHICYTLPKIPTCQNG